MGNNGLLTTAEIAALKGVSRQTVARLCKLGVLRSRYVGNLYLVTAADAKRWRPRRRGRPKGKKS